MLDHSSSLVLGSFTVAMKQKVLSELYQANFTDINRVSLCNTEIFSTPLAVFGSWKTGDLAIYWRTVQLTAILNKNKSENPGNLDLISP